MVALRIVMALGIVASVGAPLPADEPATQPGAQGIPVRVTEPLGYGDRDRDGVKVLGNRLDARGDSPDDSTGAACRADSSGASAMRDTSRSVDRFVDTDGDGICDGRRPQPRMRQRGLRGAGGRGGRGRR